MQIFVVCQPDADKTHWCELYLKGIHSEAKRKGDSVCLMTIEEAELHFRTKRPVCAALLSISRAWTADAAALLSSLGIEPLIIGGASRDGHRHASYVYMDYREATYQLIEYLRQYDRQRIALFAISSDSATDMIKKDAFLSYDGCHERDVFYYTGADGLMGAVCKRFLQACRNYDAVLCRNKICDCTRVDFWFRHSFADFNTGGTADFVYAHPTAIVKNRHNHIFSRSELNIIPPCADFYILLFQKRNNFVARYIIVADSFNIPHKSAEKVDNRYKCNKTDCKTKAVFVF